jgi:hypothetical protein
VRLRDLHKQATVERSHYYTGRCISDAINEITELRQAGVVRLSPGTRARQQRSGDGGEARDLGEGLRHVQGLQTN